MKALLDCKTHLSEKDGAPTPRKKTTFCAASARSFDAAQLERLRGWLNCLVELEHETSKTPPKVDATTAYVALLQSWLRAHSISWPSKAFSADFLSAGPGRPRERDGSNARWRCHRLWKESKSFKEIAKIVYPRECTTPVATAEIAKRVQNYVKSYRNHKKDRRDPDAVLEVAYELLAIEQDDFTDVEL
jgi:hypothetical protein